MWKRFLFRLREQLEACGFVCDFDGYSLLVNGCKFQAEDHKDDGYVTFLGSSLKVDKNGLPVRSEKALGLLLKELPRMMAEKQAKAVAAKLQEVVAGLWVHVSVSGTTPSEVYISYCSADEAKLTAVAQAIRAVLVPPVEQVA